MEIRFDRSIVKDRPELYTYVDKLSVFAPVFYIIDSRFRKSVSLVSWVKDQVENPTDKVKAILKQIKSYEDYDFQMEAILDWAIANLTYQTDAKQWKVLELWQTADETGTSLMGDCEDGSVLMYVLARLKGIPADRLLLKAGEVYLSPTAPNGGHCWLAYKPIEWPLNWVFMDWCYYPTKKRIVDRQKYYIEGTNIHGETRYQKIWFAFNESQSYKTLRTL